MAFGHHQGKVTVHKYLMMVKSDRGLGMSEFCAVFGCILQRSCFGKKLQNFVVTLTI